MTIVERAKAALEAHPHDRDLQYLVKGWQSALDRYGKKPTRGNRTAAQELEHDLLAHLEELDSQGADVQEWPDVFDTGGKVIAYLRAMGWVIKSAKTVYNHIARGDLKSRPDGRFDREAVDAYVKTAPFKRQMDLVHIVPSKTKKLAASLQESEPVRSLLDVKRDIALQELKKRTLDNQASMGQLVDILIVDREQQELCQAVRMHLSPMIRATAEQVLTMIGGDPDTARQIIAMVGGDESKADDLSAWIMGRKPELIGFYKPYLRRALDVFASGDWLTTDMREAWVSYQRQREASESDGIRELVVMVGGNVELVPDVLGRFYVRKLD